MFLIFSPAGWHGDHLAQHWHIGSPGTGIMLVCGQIGPGRVQTRAGNACMAALVGIPAVLLVVPDAVRAPVMATGIGVGWLAILAGVVGGICIAIKDALT